MLRVLIVDDEMLARDELKYLLHRTKEVDFIEEAESIEEALDKMMDEKPDLLFLDIQLSDDSGFDIAKRLKKMKNPPAIIFATAYDQYALQAFEVDAIDYILKPFDEERVVQAIHKYKKMRVPHHAVKEEEPIGESSSQTGKLAISVDDSIVLVNIEDILFVGLIEGEVTIQTITESYHTADTLAMLEKKLPSQSFVRVHRGYIVNVHHISEVQPWFNSTYNLVMKNDKRVPVSRTYAKELKKRLGI
ncbi:LytTR family transcriptional regulator DNA-binding domain-containing protein [Priestia aryabhattai]|uniref:Sensory transduction protein LytR n=1 Tax=Priestia megaterium Q3 TaxID=1452722 RepID=A0A806U1E0_PRIMG|nr:MULTISPECIES: LytTR family transcriptional regulator DNA-binding domain-containing protein [Priestia]NHH93627.1 Sensory transduction protein LytR [Bacillus sp. MB95]AKP75753.1 Sensory transduction protein LytR [Priestia megaterium Q3]MBY0076142.1 LytTR family transcriptional regulator DNA-binding domain-containing protein [Priestia aryabhattai]MCA1048303.1 LytTR family transcriptional regulator DNA-binding domain-containing protein [Priestia aryabhattai]MDT0148725.1 LytTR family transcripti